MNGLMVFSTLAAAINAGFMVYDRTSTGYLVRTRTQHGYALAIVDLRRDPR
jgi:hypothetical protein